MPRKGATWARGFLLSMHARLGSYQQAAIQWLYAQGMNGSTAKTINKNILNMVEINAVRGTHKMNTNHPNTAAA